MLVRFIGAGLDAVTATAAPNPSRSAGQVTTSARVTSWDYSCCTPSRCCSAWSLHRPGRRSLVPAPACGRRAPSLPRQAERPTARAAHKVTARAAHKVSELVGTCSALRVNASDSRKRDEPTHEPANRSPTTRTISVSPASSPSRNTSNNSDSLAISTHPHLVQHPSAPSVRKLAAVVTEPRGPPSSPEVRNPQEWGTDPKAARSGSS